jgi:hypothetical protein
MTLKEKFEDIIDDAITYQQQEDSFVQIAEDFAIGFAEWRLNKFTFKDFIHKESKELLEIYKKEKGL